ncbi:hypothetical protein CMV30_14930 [Nibricoccus aquaticus]|uniref:FHA domain-containing protein n=1 Tax=Nibricoccus aquaticus TaxID=2576891 RepID=A0A290QBX1_9BACT|nr:hypothetical protein CMV30_14930 [Nibricoccus aquaticus]
MLLTLICALPFTRAAEKIDRHALVTRHNPHITKVDPDATLTVGNSGFAFGCDITGMQTFAEFHHRNGIPTEILSRWCWVTDPNPNNYTLADASKPYKHPDGTEQPYATLASTPAGQYLRTNPRNHPLGQLALEYDKADGTPLAPEDIQEPNQTLDLWTGIVTSQFKLDGVPVNIETACNQGTDTVAIIITSKLVADGKLRLRLAFPRGHKLDVKNTPGLDWSHPATHSSELLMPDLIERQISGTKYHVRLDRPGLLTKTSPHVFKIQDAPGKSLLEVTLRFSSQQEKNELSTASVFAGATLHWQKFWESGGAIDFTGSTNPLAKKVEERIVLSQYLMAVQMAGDVPPQESGLTCSTWYGKHHTEMIWWHAAHFPLFGRDALLEKNLEWYQAQLPAARELAKFRGWKGARWAKMTGPDMRESPGGPPLIVWNQPHMVYLCELLYRNNPTPATLAKYRDLVLETADCLASMVWFDPARKQYVLGPPLWIAQEIGDQATSQNPGFELSYWRWALDMAQQWRTRLGLPRDEKWDHVIAHLAPIPQRHGMYVALESQPDTWDNIESRHDHPQMLMPLGFLPGGPDVDRATMDRTLTGVLKQWDWETKIWGWDYPLVAMTATRLGRPAEAIEVLMREGPNNKYLPTGHAPVRSDEALPKDAPPGARKREIAVYLPANGSFLATIALMVAGWDGCTEEFPGFPKDGSWQIRAEGLHRSL